MNLRRVHPRDLTGTTCHSFSTDSRHQVGRLRRMRYPNIGTLDSVALGRDSIDTLTKSDSTLQDMLTSNPLQPQEFPASFSYCDFSLDDPGPCLPTRRSSSNVCTGGRTRRFFLRRRPHPRQQLEAEPRRHYSTYRSTSYTIKVGELPFLFNISTVLID